LAFGREGRRVSTFAAAALLLRLSSCPLQKRKKKKRRRKRDGIKEGEEGAGR